jgi:mannosyltransferase
VISASKLERPAEVPRWWPYLLLTGITVLALGLRIHLLGHNSLWLDEGVSVGAAQLPWSDFLKLLWRREGNMAFYYLLLRGWIHVGNSEFAIRLLSVIAGVLSIPAVYLLGKRLFGAQTGFIAALLLTLNAFHVRHSQEPRGYSLLIFLLILSSYFFVTALESNAKDWKRYLAASVLAFYTHFYAILVIAAHFISLLFRQREATPKAQLKRSACYLVALSAPGILYLLLKRHGHLEWVPPTTLQWLYHSLMLFTGQQGMWLVLAYGAICVLAFRNCFLKSWNKLFVASWLLLPILTLLSVSLLKPLLVPRYIAMCLPALALLAATGLRELRPMWRAGGLALLVVLSCLGLRNYYRDFPWENSEWKALTEFVVSNAAPGDQVIFDNGLARPLFEYYRGSQTQRPQVLFPAHGATMTYRDFEGVATPELLASAEIYPRIWFITWKPSVPLQSQLATHFEKVQERQFRGATVQLYAKRVK